MWPGAAPQAFAARLSLARTLSCAAGSETGGWGWGEDVCEWRGRRGAVGGRAWERERANGVMRRGGSAVALSLSLSLSLHTHLALLQLAARVHHVREDVAADGLLGVGHEPGEAAAAASVRVEGEIARREEARYRQPRHPTPGRHSRRLRGSAPASHVARVRRHLVRHHDGDAELLRRLDELAQVVRLRAGGRAGGAAEWSLGRRAQRS